MTFSPAVQKNLLRWLLQKSLPLPLLTLSRVPRQNASRTAKKQTKKNELLSYLGCTNQLSELLQPVGHSVEVLIWHDGLPMNLSFGDYKGQSLQGL